MVFERELAHELSELENRNLPKDVVLRIREFVEDIGLEGISPGRRYAYILRLRKIALIIPDKFLDPSERDTKSVISKISSTNVKWGSGEEHLPTQNSIQAYQVALKKFYKWHLGKNESYPDCVKWIKIGNGHPSKQVKPESLITQDEVNKLIESSENPRDRALFSSLYDSGARIGELLSMKIRDVGFDNYGAIFKVTGKTGFRQIRIVGNSIPYLRAWIQVHPKKRDKDAWLFCKISNDVSGTKLTHHDVYSIFRKVSKRAGIKRRIHPHLFRHTRATILASRVVEAPLESQMGWVHGSKQTKTYVHLSLRDQDNAILKGYGIEIKEKDKTKEETPKECPRCGQLNPTTFTYCGTCGMPLDIKAALEAEQKEEEIEKAVEDSNVLSPLVKALIKNASQTDKVKALNTLLGSLLNDPEMKELGEAFTKEVRKKS